MVARVSPILGMLCALCVALYGVDVQAQQATAFQLEHFEPLPSQGKNVLNVGTSARLEHLGWSASVLFHYVDDPLVLVGTETQTTQARLVDQQLKMELMGSIGLFSFAELGVALPLVPYQSGDDLSIIGVNNQRVEGFALSDVRLIPKFVLFDHKNSVVPGLGLAFMLPLYLPLGDAQSFLSDDQFRAEARMIVDWRHSSGFLISSNLAYQALRSTPNVKNFVGGDNVRFALASRVPLGFEGVSVLASLFGHLSVNSPVDDLYESFDAGQPLEAQAALEWIAKGSLVAQIGAGVGLNNSIGAPAYRVILGLSYTPTKQPKHDTDNDGVLDALDACPKRPEDRDDYKDHDGCPDPDNDNDGIMDSVDQCPLEPEDRDRFKDGDGCPDPDNDGDGIKDELDKCPIDKGPASNNGCPVPDKDNDGIADADDLCIDIAEDKDGYEDEDGCPDLDNDQDGVLDQNDKCPNVKGKVAKAGCP